MRITQGYGEGTHADSYAIDDAGKDTGSKNEGAQPPAKDDVDPANAVILARDGKHTIPYSKLEEARRNEQTARADAKAAQDELAALRAQADQRDRHGPHG